MSVLCPEVLFSSCCYKEDHSTPQFYNLAWHDAFKTLIYFFLHLIPSKCWVGLKVGKVDIYINQKISRAEETCEGNNSLRKGKTRILKGCSNYKAV